MQETGVEKAIKFYDGNVRKLAEKLGTNRDKLYRYRDGTSSISPEIALGIEQITQGKVTCQELLLGLTH